MWSSHIEGFRSREADTDAHDGDGGGAGFPAPRRGQVITKTLTALRMPGPIQAGVVAVEQMPAATPHRELAIHGHGGATAPSALG
jgi:hypothetical protein